MVRRAVGWLVAVLGVAVAVLVPLRRWPGTLLVTALMCCRWGAAVESTA